MSASSVFAIEISDLHFAYGKSQPVIKSLNYHVGERERVAICAENGVGKTTLLKVLATLLAPTSGEVEIFGYSLSTEAEIIRPLLGWAPAHDQTFFMRLTGFENLCYFAAVKGLKKSDVNAQIHRWIHILPLKDALETPFCLCSTGMKQSLNLARAFLGSPRLLLLDEPFRSLSPRVTTQFIDLLLQFSATVVLSCHDPKEVSAWTDRTLFLEPSVQELKPKELLHEL